MTLRGIPATVGAAPKGALTAAGFTIEAWVVPPTAQSAPTWFVRSSAGATPLRLGWDNGASELRPDR